MENFPLITLLDAREPPMGITQRDVLSHWNYFLCLEDDVANLARWVEFSTRNFDCYSIEMARLLMTASSEVDVIAKLLCKSIDPSSRADGINKYQEEITGAFPTIHKGLITIPRYGIDLHPWENWKVAKCPPLWWSANNKVKHHRSEEFHQATLKNVLNAVAALLVMLILFYRDRVNELRPLSELFIPKAFLINMGDQFHFFPKCV